MLAGFTTEEARYHTIADQELKRVNRIFEGLNEGIWTQLRLGHQTKFNELFSLDRSGGSSTGLMRNMLVGSESQESAGSLHPDESEKRRRRGASSRKHTIADQELKRVNRIFEGLNEGIWTQLRLGHQTKFDELFSLDRSGGSSTGLMRKYASWFRDSIGYPRMKESDESSTTKHRLLHASGAHQIPPPNDPKKSLAIFRLLTMASSYYTNTLHVNFESVLAMDDPCMVSMFQALMASGLEGFLGCPAVIYEAALVDFFENASVRDEGLSELLEIPKDLVFDARCIVSLSGELVSMYGKKKEMKFEYRLLCDIMAKTISVKAGSFNAITMEKFLMLTSIVCGVRINWTNILFNILKKMVSPGSRQAKGYAVQISLLLENVPNLELGESSEFTSTKILTEKTVHLYITLNDKVGMEEAADAPKVTRAPKKKAASKKRPADVPVAETVVKKKRTTKKKYGSSTDNVEMVAVSLEAVPIQII
ncbi:hypothetical protein F511_20977 [Dorcoceras hygrometricum]|uniref:Dystroglycan-like n=1 Tax=Dorcoceras hygrometricum TaxID=472368 RepID=A0A2Z7AC91_9LAMI|nr:hypothetical protein F511_20977 [Dorcoceras hygrometricum]